MSLRKCEVTYVKWTNHHRFIFFILQLVVWKIYPFSMTHKLKIAHTSLPLSTFQFPHSTFFEKKKHDDDKQRKRT